MKKILISALAMMVGISSYAQSLVECCSLAREHYPVIRNYGLIDRSEEYNLSNAARSWIPQVSLSGQASWQNEVPTFPEALSKMLESQGIEHVALNKDQYRVALNVHQNIWDGGVSAAERDIAKAEAKRQRSSMDVELYQIEERVENLYFGILLLDKKIEQIGLKMRLLEANLKKVRSLTGNGVALDSDADLVEVELLSAAQQLEQAAASRSNYRMMLELFIGQRLDDGALALPIEAEVSSFESDRPELSVFDASIDLIDAKKRMIKTAAVPRIGAYAQGYYGYPGYDLFESMLKPDWNFNVQVGIRLTWNIGAFYTHSNRLGQLSLASEQVSLRKDAFLFNNRLSAVQQNGELGRLSEAVERDRKIVELRKRVRMTAESRLMNGTIGMTDFLQKITEEMSALSAQSAHEIELIQMQYRLKRTLNR